MQPSLSINQKRINSIDLLRGLIMIIMALDHVRDYFHAGSFLYDPLDLNKTSVAIFFTRWITHFCAPIFMLLAGTSAFLIGQKKTKKALSGFLFKRGLWLIFLEMVVVNLGWNFNILFPNFLFITIWALGISMMVLAALRRYKGVDDAKAIVGKTVFCYWLFVLFVLKQGKDHEWICK